MATSDRSNVMFKTTPFYALVRTVLRTKITAHCACYSKCVFVLKSGEFRGLNDGNLLVLLRFAGHDRERMTERCKAALRVNENVFCEVALKTLNISKLVRECHNCVLIDGMGSKYPEDLHICVQVVAMVNRRQQLSLASRNPTVAHNVVKAVALVDSFTARNDVVGDVSVHAVRASLKCPLLQARLLLPCRGQECKHLQCFDACAYLRLNESTLRPKWCCPICDKDVDINGLRIDLFMADVLAKTPETCESIEVLGDGSWSAVDSDDDEMCELNSSIVDLTLDM